MSVFTNLLVSSQAKYSSFLTELGNASGAGLARDLAQVVSESISDIPGLWKPPAISALIPSWAAGRPSEAMHASYRRRTRRPAAGWSTWRLVLRIAVLRLKNSCNDH
jgi:hypothetical protein